jgi:outer membrane protein assembly factor BamE (lipoprotein component of BamABCDE complex)
MNTISKIALAFILGVICTFGVLYIMSRSLNTEENTEINIQSFELTTKNGIVKLNTYMPKDSVQAIMGRPQSTDIHNNKYIDQVRETWKYRGSNSYIDEFTIEFINGELESVRQYKDH